MTGQPQVISTRIDGSGLFYLGSLGHVDALTYADAMPGGPDSASFVLQYPPSQRHEAFNLGRRLHVIKGGGIQWSGSLVEPTPGDAGWTITADGAGNWGTRFDAIYSSYTADDVITQAIARGLPWIKGSVGGGYYGTVVDSGSQTVTEFLNATTRPQSQTWRVRRVSAGLQVDVIPIPTGVTRLLVCTNPVARTVAGYYNRLYARYEATADSSGTAATYATRSASNAASISLHDVLEAYWDLSGSGVLSASAVDGLLASALAQYTAASFAGPYTVQHGQYLTVGGVPVDLGCEKAGEVAQLIMMDGPQGAQLTPGPVTFPVGKVEYTASSDSLAVSPFQLWTGSFSDMLNTLTPVAPA